MSSLCHPSRAPPPFPQTSPQPLSWFAVLFQKLAVTDCPLYLRLLAGPDTNVLSFVLKENETGDVEVRLGPFAGVQTQPSWHSGWVQVGITLLAPHMWGHMAAGKRLEEKVELGLGSVFNPGLSAPWGGKSGPVSGQACGKRRFHVLYF